MNIGRILFLVIFLFSAATLLTISSALEMVKNNIQLPYEQDLISYKKQLELEKSYKESLLRILGDYNSRSSQLSEQELSSLEAQLLDLKVPASLTDLHFELAISLASINQQIDQTEKEIIAQRLENMIKQYSWLTSSVSLFLLNNF